VKAVNLLPEKHRPRRPTASKSGSGYIALGVLGAVLIAVLVYVFTLNSLNSSKTKITEAKAEAVRLDSQANSLGPYGDFAKIKTERVRSVQTLAQGRFDWERLVRELATVLPSDVWLVNATASASGDSGTGTAGASSSTPPAPGAAPAATGPSLALEGCARDQSQVAVTLVRLRELQGATDVSLDHSTRVEDSSAGNAPASAPAASAGGANGDNSCGTTGGKPNYSFQVNVTFAPTAPTSSEPARVPARLGGGA
jgi:Tfp pilus assembly protein PilN